MSEGGLKTALETIRGEGKARFEAQKRVLSYGEYLELVQDNPRRLLNELVVGSQKLRDQGIDALTIAT